MVPYGETQIFIYMKISILEGNGLKFATQGS